MTRCGGRPFELATGLQARSQYNQAARFVATELMGHWTSQVIHLMDAVRIQAKFVVVSPTRVLHPGQLVVRRGRVVEITRSLHAAPDIDLGDAVLIPGLINAHSHLEFSGLQQPFPAGEHFPQWVSQVVSYRNRLQPESLGGKPDPLPTAIHAGLRECFSTGSIVVADIVTPPWRAQCLPGAREFRMNLGSCSPAWDIRVDTRTAANWRAHIAPLSFPRVVVMPELLGLSRQRLEASWQWACGLAAQDAGQLPLYHGLSPHAPYSLHFPTLQLLLGSLPATTLLAMHVAESLAELQWVNEHTGPFLEVFERLGIPADVRPPSIEQCIELLARTQRSLLIHGNYLSDTQIRQVAQSSGITVVFCPRTHLHFGHDPYPLQRLTAAGVNLALATDSRASNPDLSLWDEAAEVKRRHPWVTGSDLLKWVTTSPARALRLEDDFGSLDQGRLACACVARTQPHWVCENLLDEMSQHTASELGLIPLSGLMLALSN